MLLSFKKLLPDIVVVDIIKGCLSTIVAVTKVTYVASLIFGRPSTWFTCYGEYSFNIYHLFIQQFRFFSSFLQNLERYIRLISPLINQNKLYCCLSVCIFRQIWFSKCLGFSVHKIRFTVEKHFERNWFVTFSDDKLSRRAPFTITV